MFIILIFGFIIGLIIGRIHFSNFKYIVRYPSIYDTNQIYIDDNNVCYKYNLIEIECSQDDFNIIKLE
jgi:hypothetical protein